MKVSVVKFEVAMNIDAKAQKYTSKMLNGTEGIISHTLIDDVLTINYRSD